MPNFLPSIFIAGSEEVKDIEFTVTTLNCPQDAGTPEQRRKFSSLRKTGALSKAVRSKISKSFYHNSSDNKKNDRTAVITVTPLDDEKNNDGDHTDSQTDATKLPMGNNSKSSASSTITMTTTMNANKSEKHKKRSKLCQLL